MNQEKVIEAIIEALQDKKAKNIVVANMSEIEEATFEYFVICEGSSTTQVGGIAENVIDHLRENIDIKPYGYDGFKNSQWIVIDYGTILVHVFIKEQREFYNLEQLWADAILTEIEDLD